MRIRTPDVVEFAVRPLSWRRHSCLRGALWAGDSSRRDGSRRVSTQQTEVCATSRPGIALLILAIFTCAALSAQPRPEPHRSAPKILKPVPRPQVHVAPHRPSPAPKAATPRVVRPPAPAERHLGPNPAVITGAKGSSGAIDGTRVHRRP